MGSTIRVQVDDEAASALRRGRPWVYREAVLAAARGSVGEHAEVVDRRGEFLARGLYDPEGSIAVRVLSRRRAETLDRRLLERRLEAALRLRRRLLDLSQISAWRLCNGEGDYLPGLVLEVYGPYVVVQLSTPAWAPHRGLVCDALREVLAPRGIVEKSRLRPGAKGEVVAHLDGEEPPEELEVREGASRFAVTLRGTPKSGLFLDQRDTRTALLRLARDAEVLNGFCYTGSLSVASALGGARKVVSLDLSGTALARARRNFTLNGLDPEAHEWVRGDLFVTLPRLCEAHRRFDLVILDPPAFATSKKRLFQAERDWRELAGLGVAGLRPGGVLVASSPMATLPAAALERALAEGAHRSGTTLRIVESRSLPPDHPVDPACPERRYLKVFFAVRD